MRTKRRAVKVSGSKYSYKPSLTCFNSVGSSSASKHVDDDMPLSSNEHNDDNDVDENRNLGSEGLIESEEWSHEQNSTCLICKSDSSSSSSELLVCMERSCSLAFHEKCLGCMATFDEFGNFYCPSCTYKRALAVSLEARNNVLSAKNSLSDFIKFPVGPKTPNSQMRGGDDHDDHHTEMQDPPFVEETKEDETSKESNGVNPKTHNDHDDETREDEPFKESDAINPKTHNDHDEETREDEPSKESDAINPKTHDDDDVNDEIKEGETSKEPGAVNPKTHDLDDEELNSDDDYDDDAYSDDDLAEMQNLYVVEESQEDESSTESDATDSTTHEENIPIPTQRDNVGPSTNASSSKNNDTDERVTKRKPPMKVEPTLLNRPRRNKLKWTTEEEDMLKEGVHKYAGIGKNVPWRKILEFGRHIFHDTRTPDDLRDKWRHNLCKQSSPLNKGRPRSPH